MCHVHSVFFWVKKEIDLKVFAEGVRRLALRLGALKSWCGQSAGTGRAVADDTFSVGAHLAFATREDHDAYQASASHDDFVKQWANSWERVQVYDVQSD